MSYPTQEAFVHAGTWDATTRKHPAMKWMEDYTNNIIDGRKFHETASSVGWTTEFTLKKSTGEVVEGADKAWAALQEIYAPFSEHVHDPTFCVCWETEKGWDMLGVASMWYNLQAPGEGKMKGFGGKEWDGVLSSAFKFAYIKGGKDGVELASTEIFSDPSAAMVQMLKRGMLKPEQLMQ
ncbi:hypothetical protein LTR91_023173 [Friedmanniomyces endolithicus]|uniref:Uncharacterized protein n=1 Tax=Friedmanniomyces endolithicus TaxID=329885 RepID=A0AAN6H4N5_9PEZI|nr:hypothetical protein LTR94_020775 [Friedmanniomyces endolithicus]KAK0778528.1 hypothetical protein LTR59_013496 [Friedmanniomyces endolithicus]KAK0954738.1 hypothetical protein LTR91_023173 [Friedmanniomyces endolithicus]